MEEYKQWCGKEVDKYLLADYQKARQRLKKREPLETSLANTEGAEQLDKFRQYVALEKEEGEPARVQCLYERAVAEHCLVDVLWEEYLAYMESTFKVGLGSFLLSFFPFSCEICLLKCSTRWDQ